MQELQALMVRYRHMQDFPNNVDFADKLEYNRHKITQYVVFKINPKEQFIAFIFRLIYFNRSLVIKFLHKKYQQ